MCTANTSPIVHKPGMLANTINNIAVSGLVRRGLEGQVLGLHLMVRVLEGKK